MKTTQEKDKATARPITAIQYTDIDGSGAGGKCSDKATLSVWASDEKITSVSVSDMVKAVNEYAALNAVAEAVQAMKHDINIFYAKYRERGNAYKANLDKALANLAALRKAQI